ncbi:MAG: hypothetical protein ACPGUE_21235 [Marinomonas sp.]
MSVSKIKANYAEFEGEYLHITRCPLRIWWFLGGGFVGFLLIVFLINPVVINFKITDEYITLYYFLFIMFSGFVFVMISGEKEEYYVSKDDVLVIKKRKESRKVTVVLDEERVFKKLPVRID